MVSPTHVLVIDESEHLGVLIEAVLLRAGVAEVILVDGPAVALQAISALPDRRGNVALVDRYVLGGGCAAVIAALRARGIPIVIDGEPGQGCDAGLVVLPKPYGAQALVEGLRAALSA